MSSPSRSSSSLTRRPITRSTILYDTAATTPDHTTVSSTALSWIHTCAPMPLEPTVAVTQSVTRPGPPSDCVLNTPVSSAPTMPPMPCTPNTSSESSAPSSFFSPLTPHRQANPATAPMMMAPIRPTLPAAGVIATRPATAPEAAPSIDALPRINVSPTHQASTAAEVAVKVFMNASTAELPASSAEPALKPNQPTHSIAAPTMVSGRLCGGNASLP